MKSKWGRDVTPTFMIQEPFLIPGYSGYTPQYKFVSFGGTYGRLTHKLLTNPTWESRRTILSKVKPEEVSPRPVAVAREELRQNPRNDRDPVIYSGDMKTGYAGHVPHMDHFHGSAFPDSSLLAIASFHKQQRERKRYLTDVDFQVAVQAGSIALKNVPTCTQATPKAIRYGCPLPRSYAEARPYVSPHKTGFGLSPYDLENGDPNKYINSGYAGHIPLIRERCGHTKAQLSVGALEEFYQGRPFYHAPIPEDIITSYDATEPPPSTTPPPRRPHDSILTKEDLVLLQRSSKRDLKPKKFPVPLGLTTTYKGHIQGLKDVVGMTFGNATKHIYSLRCPNPLEL